MATIFERFEKQQTIIKKAQEEISVIAKEAFELVSQKIHKKFTASEFFVSAYGEYEFRFSTTGKASRAPRGTRCEWLAISRKVSIKFIYMPEEEAFVREEMARIAQVLGVIAKS